VGRRCPISVFTARYIFTDPKIPRTGGAGLVGLQLAQVARHQGSLRSPGALGRIGRENLQAMLSAPSTTTTRTFAA